MRSVGDEGLSVEQLGHRFIDAFNRRKVRVRAVRRLSSERFAMLTEVLVEGEVTSPSAMIAALRDGLIAHAKAYLSDEQTLIRVGVLPPRDDA
jgi:hypothetical protein